MSRDAASAIFSSHRDSLARYSFPPRPPTVGSLRSQLADSGGIILNVNFYSTRRPPVHRDGTTQSDLTPTLVTFSILRTQTGGVRNAKRTGIGQSHRRFVELTPRQDQGRAENEVTSIVRRCPVRQSTTPLVSRIARASPYHRRSIRNGGLPLLLVVLEPKRRDYLRRSSRENRGRVNPLFRSPCLPMLRFLSRSTG